MTDPSRLALRAGNWTRLRDAAERRFERWGHVVYRHAWLTIALSLATVAGLATQLPRFEIDTSTEGFLEEGDPVRVAYDEFRRLFGRDEIIVLAVEGKDVFDLAFLEKLRALHRDIEREVPKLEDVTSLINARSTRGVEDELIVEDFLEDWPESAVELETLRERALANPLYRDQILSADAQLTTVLIETDAYTSVGEGGDELAGFDDIEAPAGTSEQREFLTGEENTEIVAAIQAVVARHTAPDFRIHIAGTPVMIDQLMRAMLSDMGIFAALSLVAIGLFLAFLFRSVTAVALSLVVSVLAVISTLSVMAMLGIPLTSPSQIMPSFLLAVGVGNSVHLLVIYFQARRRGQDGESALAYALGHSGLAIVMTALTTAGGLLSFTTAEIAPVADVGIICPIGAMLALAFSLVLLPALIAVIPMDAVARTGTKQASLLRRIPIRCGEVSTRFPVAIAGVWAVVLAISMVGALRVEFSHHPIGWFAPDHPLRVATERMNEDLKGSIFLEIVMDAGQENGLHSPDLLRGIEAAQRRLLNIRSGELYIGKTVSLADVTKEIHQALNENRSDFYVIPPERALVAQELLLFENAGSDDLENFVDSRFQLGRLTLKLPLADSIGFDSLMEKMEPVLEETLGDSVDFTITGNWSILGRTINALIRSLSRTYLVAFLTITPLMMILLGSVRLGALSMFPNVGAIVVTVGLMGWCGVPLDVFTLMIGSIALGLAVDDTIHFMHNFRRAYSRTGDAPAAVRTTMESTGEALLFTSLVLTTGFCIYMFASMKNLYFFGLLTGTAIAVAFIANVTLAPALVTLVARTRAADVLRAGAPDGGPDEICAPGLRT